MIIKPFPETPPHVEALTELLKEASGPVKKQIENEIKTTLAGFKTEKESAYVLDFNIRNSNNIIILHDLRIDLNDLIAQIDHLVINRALEVYVCESKSVGGKLKVSKNGEFQRYNPFSRSYEMASSPFKQNERHIAVLKDAFKQIAMPKRIGLRLWPNFKSIVLCDSMTSIDLEDKAHAEIVMRCDDFLEHYNRQIDKFQLSDFARALNTVSAGTLMNIGRQLLALHTPITFDWRARFGLPASTPLCVDKPSPSSQTEVQDMAAYCDGCNAPVDKKVVNFCRRFNKKRFAGNVYCRNCQPQFPERP